MPCSCGDPNCTIGVYVPYSPPVREQEQQRVIEDMYRDASGTGQIMIETALYQPNPWLTNLYNTPSVPQGWQCPACKTIHNPIVLKCGGCQNVENS